MRAPVSGSEIGDVGLLSSLAGAPASAAIDSNQAGSNQSAGHVRVLLVCEDERMQEQLRRSTADPGYSTQGVSSPEAAARLLSQQPFDIVVVDMNLPGAGGHGLLKMLRQYWTWVQIILLAHVNDADTEKRAIQSDAVDLLTRPFSNREITAALTRAHRRRNPAPPAPVLTHIARAATAPMSATSLEDIERVHIFAALERHNGNREAAAEELGISVRKLYYRLQQYHRHGKATTH